jgi:hypothetical protein
MNNADARTKEGVRATIERSSKTHAGYRYGHLSDRWERKEVNHNHSLAQIAISILGIGPRE